MRRRMRAAQHRKGAQPLMPALSFCLWRQSDTAFFSSCSDDTIEDLLAEDEGGSQGEGEGDGDLGGSLPEEEQPERPASQPTQVSSRQWESLQP